MARNRTIAGVAAVAVITPVVAATQSPLLQWRDPVYIAAGFAGILALTLLLIQPLLIKGALPGFAGPQGRRAHHWIGGLIVAAILMHVLGLWLTSPPDVIDVLLFRSPTPFAIWGVVAMWAAFITACIAALRRPMRLSPRRWRQGHSALATLIVLGSVVHALLIEGTMEIMTKAVLCALVVLAAAWGLGAAIPRRR